MQKIFRIKLGIVFFVFLYFFFPSLICADSQGQVKIFFVNSEYSLQSKDKIQTTLLKVSQEGYFYVEDEWYKNLSQDDKKIIDQNLEILSQEFDKKIYPKLTSFYGQEWKPGIDNDTRITIVFHQMKENHIGGYFTNIDEYPRLQNPASNEREMVYLNTQALLSQNSKSYLAHEFVHLISFNQKERLRGVTEDFWLNESRAEYAPTYLGYDDEYQGSNLQQRVKLFLSAPSDSLTEWKNQKNDYGIINIFTQYLADQYGNSILADSLKSEKTGISSINAALLKAGFSQDFSKIFTDWTITIYLNDCKFGEKYCYKNQNLKNLRINPSLIFFPATYKTQFLLDYSISQWSGNWYRIVGGEGKLTVRFAGDLKAKFQIPYVLCQDSSNCKADFMILDNLQKGEITFDNFGKDWTSLTLIPSIENKTSGFGSEEDIYNFSITASMTNTPQEEKLIQDLKARILELQKLISETQARINAILAKKLVCSKIESNLHYGLQNNQEVRCLQQFLKSQGSEIYPEGLITGNFFSLTQKAVVKFQEKYAAEILTPYGLTQGSGAVDLATRNKINQLLAK
ncbi:MAG: peptidoglycan-binding domain-containing protein [Candidatus Pacebacteria bacterium]|nr:peptidoglycan-binding domain-containing protein [Candidatus Paceibacterota bacterium]